MQQRIRIDHPYLYLPIQKNQPVKRLEIWEAQGNKCFEFLVPAGENYEEQSYDYMAEIVTAPYIGKELILQGDFSEGFWQLVECSREAKTWKESHPAIHFTPKYGWMNDPNGLVYADGTYHLYFQYNPFQVVWNNMSWGHAVSKDLLHWEQLDTVLYPDEHGTMFSGSGLVNERGLLGLPKDALLFFYTAAGGTNEWSREKEFTQRIAYSLDGGKTLHKLAKPYIDTICKENRDPKVFWHEETGAYICVLWLEENDFAVLRSENLEDWEMTDRIMLENAWECPDLLKLTGENGEEKWLFWSADGYYFWGEFDGYHFSITGKRQCAYMGKVAYAAQTYSGVKGRIVSIPWLKLQNDGRNFTGAMGLPREFSFRYEGEECLLVQKPVRELFSMLETDRELLTSSMEFAAEAGKAYWIELSLPVESAGVIEVKGVNFTLCYDQKTGELAVNGEIYRAGAGRRELSLLLDDSIFEVSLDGGVKTGMFDLGKAAALSGETQNLRISSDTEIFMKILW